MSRYKRNDPNVLHRGVMSPMAEVEIYIVSICIQKDEMNQSITPTEGISLANSIVYRTDVQTKICDFRKKRHRTLPSNSTGPALTWNYWRGFMKRNGHKISAIKKKNFQRNSSEWCTYQNLTKMYNLVYSVFVKAVIATELPVPEYQGEDGNPTTEAKSFWMPVTHKFLFSDMIIHADEVGNNTNMRKDGDVGGE